MIFLAVGADNWIGSGEECRGCLIMNGMKNGIYGTEVFDRS
jgi:hypothetical protein